MADSRPQPNGPSEEQVVPLANTPCDAKPERNLDELSKEQAVEDAAFLADLERDFKELDKDTEIARILKAFRANPYDVLDLQPGVPDEDIKRAYRKKSLLIHPDKSSNPNAQEAFDRLAKAYQALLDEKLRAILDEAISDARMLLMRDRGLNQNSEEVKDPDVEFMNAWREKTKWVLRDNELRLQRQRKAQMQEEGRQQRKDEEELHERKRKREHEQDWEKTREQRIDSWRDFQKKKGGGEGSGKKGKKLKTLG